MATASQNLDRVAVKVVSVKSDIDLALTHFGEGQLFQASNELVRARQTINAALVTIRRRGA